MKITKKQFRQYLNNKYGVDTQKWGNGNYAARKRAYGDYLYNQDREMFNIEYAKFMNNNELPENWEELTPKITG